MGEVERLYEVYGVLADAKENVGQRVTEYLEILQAVKGSSGAKRLASQFIVRFFKHFPHHRDDAINAMLDLCEDDDVAIRKQAIKDLPSMCRESPDYHAKIADILAQLMLSEDSSEIAAVHNSLMTLLKLNAAETIHGLFMQVRSGDEAVREKALQFLSIKVRLLDDEVMNKEAEQALWEECQKVINDVSGKEFVMAMTLLSHLKLFKTVPGKKQLVDAIAALLELEKPFQVGESDHVNRLYLCLKQITPHFSSLVPTTPFLLYICNQVMPHLATLAPLTVKEGSSTDLEVLKLLAELAPHCGQLQEPATTISVVYDKLLEYMPLPATETAETPEDTPVPKFEFSYVEALMYTFHQLCRKYPDFLVAEENAERLKDFRSRLQYYALSSQEYSRKIREAIQASKSSGTSTESSPIHVVALKTTSNINGLIRDLLHNPPSYKTSIVLSWKTPVPKLSTGSSGGQAAITPPTTTTPENTDPSPSTGTKRKHTPITFENGSSTSITKKAALSAPGKERAIYAPPGGKYSTQVKDFALPSGNRVWVARGRGRIQY